MKFLFLCFLYLFLLTLPFVNKSLSDDFTQDPICLKPKGNHQSDLNEIDSLDVSDIRSLKQSLDWYKKYEKDSFDLNARGLRSGNTALHSAVNTQKIEAVKLLLENGADPNVLSCEGMTPLHLALGFSGTSLEIIQALVEAGADVNATFGPTNEHRDGGTVVTMLIPESSIDLITIPHSSIFNYLYQHGADFNKPTPTGLTPAMAYLHYIGNRSLNKWVVLENIACAFIKFGAQKDTSYQGRTLEFICSEREKLGFSLDFEESLDGRLLRAAELGDAKTVKDLIGQGANVNVRYEAAYSTPLSAAIASDSVETLSLLLNAGAVPSKDTYSLLEQSLDTQNISIVKLLLDHHAYDNHSLVEFIRNAKQYRDSRSPDSALFGKNVLDLLYSYGLTENPNSFHLLSYIYDLLYELAEWLTTVGAIVVVWCFLQLTLVVFLDRIGLTIALTLQSLICIAFSSLFADEMASGSVSWEGMLYGLIGLPSIIGTTFAVISACFLKRIPRRAKIIALIWCIILLSIHIGEMVLISDLPTYGH